MEVADDVVHKEKIARDFYQFVPIRNRCIDVFFVEQIPALLYHFEVPFNGQATILYLAYMHNVVETVDCGIGF